MKHLLSIKELSLEEISNLLERGDFYANQDFTNVPSLIKPLTNPIICNLFFESSTRTRFSFEVAAKKLGYHVLNFHPSSSSTTKGESFYDTIKTLEAMGVRVAIVRAPEENILQEISPNVDLALINAGAGVNEHPTQGLLDLLTMKQEFGEIPGLKVAIIGDIKHSRVANSNMIALTRFGADILLAGPSTWMPDTRSLGAFVNAHIVEEVDDAIASADVVMMLRVQKERHSSVEVHDNYLDKYGMNTTRYKMMKKNAIIMHPAPFNRGIEIDGSLVESPRSRIYKQVSNGVSIRMAVLERALS